MRTVPVRHGRRVVDAFVDDADFERLVDRDWHIGTYGYPTQAARHADGRKTTVRMHQLVLGAVPDGREPDHINGNKLDNRRANLRIVTHAQNMANRTGLNSNNGSGYRGVSFDRARGLWRAQAKVNNRSITLGRFSTVAQAAEAVAAFWRELELA